MQSIALVVNLVSL